MHDLPTPLRATARGWIPKGIVHLPHGLAEHWINRSERISCFSAIEMVEQNPPGSKIIAPHFHVSAVKLVGGRPHTCSDQDMELVRAAFGLGGAEEDNHGPGKARHLWILCGREKEPACPCKQDELQVRTGDRVQSVAQDEVQP